MTSKKIPGVEYNVKTPPKRSPISRHFVKGWWENMDGKEIKEAWLGDKVRFHLRMKNIESPKGKKVNLELREWDKFDFLLYILSFINKELVGYKNAREYETIHIVSTSPENNEILTDWEMDENSEIIIPLLLDENALTKMVANDAGRDLELYFRCRYIDEGNIPEIVELPWENQDYLKVKLKPVTEPIIFVHASDKHLLPAMYSAADGSPWYIAVMKNGMYVNKINTLSKPYGVSPSKEIAGLEKKAYDIAIRNLEKKNFFSTVRRGTTSEYYYYDISDIDNRFGKEIKRAVNIGSETSANIPKGMNAIEYKSGKGLPGKIKVLGEVLGIFGVLADLAALLRGVADHEIPMPSIVPPFVTMEVTRIFNEMNESNREFWVKNLRKEIPKGKTAVKDYLNINSYNDGIAAKNIGYKLIEISEIVLEKVLKKEIKEIDPKKDLSLEHFFEKESQGNTNYGILFQSVEKNDKFNRPTIYHYIHALFIKDLAI